MSAWLLVGLLASPVEAGSFVDARDHPAPGAGTAAFAVMERALVRGFDDICGDTFCEGDYANLRALQLRCAVEAGSGVVSACLWSFAGSHASVDPLRAMPQVDARTWVCPLPLAAATRLSDLLQALSGEGALDMPLPGSRVSTYDALTECL